MHTSSLGRLWGPVVLGAACVGLMGLECQYEPLPDMRRGFLGDLCRADGTCEPCRRDDAGVCSGAALYCSNAESPPRCRTQCSLAPQDCGQCGPAARCTPVVERDGGVSAALGTCLPAPAEGETCGLGVCAGCLNCAQDGDSVATCRRTCDPAVDAGPAGKAITGPHPYCLYADLPETGAVVLQNCCLFGQSCTRVTQGEGNADVCFGPLPKQPGSTCLPGAGGAAGTCNSNALCIPGQADQDIPDTCVAAGGLNQPCRSNTTCDPNLICISSGEGQRPICRGVCQPDEALCGTSCPQQFDCVAAFDNRGGRLGDVCVPAVQSAQSCASSLCERCLVCGSQQDRPDAGSTCRHACRTDVDAGTTANPIFAQPGDCPQPTLDGEAPILANCCPQGQTCFGFVGGNGAVCF